MNIKKNLSLLSATILLASNAHAIPVIPGGNAVVILNTAGQGSFWVDSGVSADDIALNGASFNVDVSAASAALGGTIEEFAILGFSSPVPTSYPFPGGLAFNYDEYVYVDPGAGLVYATSNPSPASSNLQLINQLNDLQQFVENASFGFNPEGSLGDVDGNANFVFGLGGGLLNTVYDLAFLYHQYQNEFGTSTTLHRTHSFYGNVTLQNNRLAIMTPIPNAAWLFISALGGLTIARPWKKTRYQHKHK